MGHLVLPVFITTGVNGVASVCMFSCRFLCVFNMFLQVVLMERDVHNAKRGPWFFKFKLNFMRKVSRPHQRGNINVTISRRRQRDAFLCLLRDENFRRIPSMLLPTRPIYYVRGERNKRIRLYFRFSTGLIPCTYMTTIFCRALSRELLMLAVLRFTKCRRNNNNSRKSAIRCRLYTTKYCTIYVTTPRRFIDNFNPLRCIGPIFPTRLYVISLTRPIPMRIKRRSIRIRLLIMRVTCRRRTRNVVHVSICSSYYF